MDRILFDKRASNAHRTDLDESIDGLWLGAEAMVAPDCLREARATAPTAATERDVDPSWCVV